MSKIHLTFTAVLCIALVCTISGCKRTDSTDTSTHISTDTASVHNTSHSSSSAAEKEATAPLTKKTMTEKNNPAETMPSQEIVDVDIPAAFNAHGFALFNECTKMDVKEAKNTIVSPFSIATALAMTYNGATNETKMQMASVLNIKGVPLEGFNASVASLITSLENADPGIKLSIANSLWAADDIPFKKPFMTRTRHFYSAAVYNVDFLAGGTLKRINGWVEEKTHDKIKNLVKKDDLTKDTLLILINALYFNGTWTEPFIEKRTQKRPFNLSSEKTVSVPIMERDDSFPYIETESYQAVRLSYGENKRLAMTVVLPSVNNSLEDFIAEVDAEKWHTLQKSLRKRDGLVGLPRFTLEYEVSLKSVLSQLGMPIAFDKQRADFHPMCVLKPDENAYISEVRHKTFIEVNEKGTEAAAATAVVMMRTTTAMPVERFRMVCDRPFFFAISDTKTDTVLFLGAVRSPLE